MVKSKLYPDVKSHCNVMYSNIHVHQLQDGRSEAARK